MLWSPFSVASSGSERLLSCYFRVTHRAGRRGSGGRHCACGPIGAGTKPSATGCGYRRRPLGRTGDCCLLGRVLPRSEMGPVRLCPGLGRAELGRFATPPPPLGGAAIGPSFEVEPAGLSGTWSCRLDVSANLLGRRQSFSSDRSMNLNATDNPVPPHGKPCHLGCLPVV